MFNFKTNLLNKMKNKALFFTNLKSFILIATFFSLWLAVYFEDTVEDFFAYFLILSLGILHGTNDIKLIERTSKAHKKKNSYRTLIIYVSTISISILLFYFLPIITLSLFIILSAFHFGEQHWSSKIIDKNIYAKLINLFYGMIILFMLFYTNHIEVSPIIENITGINPHKVFYKYTLAFSSLLFVIFGLVMYSKKKIKTNIIEELFYLVVFFIVFYTASLLWAFAIYFIFWHSIPSVADQVYYLYGNLKKENFYNYLKSSILYWFISIIGLSILYFLFYNEGRLFLSIFFTLIAAITFPHIWIMARFNKQF